MTFQNPQLLVLLVLLLPVAWLLRAGHGRTGRLLQAYNAGDTRTRGRHVYTLLLALLFLAAMLVTAAGPGRYITSPDQQQSGSFVFLLDVSRSMAARNDCGSPMRLEPARALMSGVVADLPMAKYGFAAFTELAFVFSELSYDQHYLQEIIANGLFVESVPIPGSDIGNALLVIAEKKTGEPPVYAGVGDVILLSDGDITEEAEKQLAEVAPALREAGIQVTSVGIGAESGEPIPTLDRERNCLEGQFERADGKEFYTHLFEQPLRFIAEETGGRYFSENQYPELLAYLASRLQAMPERPPVQVQDISPLFLLLATLSLLGLVLIRYF